MRIIAEHEFDAALHQIGTERDIAAETVELGHQDRRLELVGGLERSRELGPAIQRISALAGLDLFKGLDQVVALCFSEPGECRLLCFKTQAGFALLSGRYPGVGDGGFHGSCP